MSHKGRLCVITGAAGFIGCALSQALLQRYDRIIAVDSLLDQVHPDGRRPAALPAAVELVVGDVADAAVWEQVVEAGRPDLVVHLAAETGTGQSLTESTRHAMANVVGTTRMLDAFVRHDVRPGHLLLTSSRAVYGEGPWRGADGVVFYPPQRSHEQLARAQWDHIAPDGSVATAVPMDAMTTHPNPSSVYGSTKLAQELVMRNWALSFGLPLSVFRLQNVYGPGQSPHNPYTGIVTLFHRLAARGQSLEIYEDGEIGRDFVYIDDVVRALLAGIDTPPVSVRLLDVGTGVATTIAEAARIISQYHGAPQPRVVGRFRDGDVRYAAADIRRLTDGLGWTPEWDYMRGSSVVAEWLREGGFLDD